MNPPPPVTGPGPLGAQWPGWVARHALAGVPPAELVDALVAEGVDLARATAEVAAVTGSPVFEVARAAAARGAAVERAARLHRELDPEPLVVRDALDEHTLYREHWTPGRPVVVRGAASGWPAARWTFPELGRRFPWAPIDVLVRGEGWWHQPRVTRRTTFGALVDTALGPPSDHLYADGRVDLLDQAAMAPLRAELGLLPGLVGDGHPRAWVGPAATITPTHHDQSTGWLVQLIGHKRVHLASPLEPELADTAVGLYNTVDPRERTGAARWHRVDLAPGDALLTPVGWWHHVEALTPSFSVSFSRFRWPNAFPWFVAGRS